MPVLTDDATWLDLEATKFERVLSQSQIKTCEGYSLGFCRLANETDAAGEARQHAAARMMAFLCSLRLHADDPREPLRSGNPSLRLGELDDRDITFLRAIAPHFSDCDLQARIRDMLWLRASDASAGRDAISSYCESARRLLPDRGLDAADRCERAARLLLSLRETDQQAEIATIAKTAFDDDSQPLTFITVRFVQVLMLLESFEPAQAAGKLMTLSERADRESNPLLRRRLLELASECFRRANDPDQQRQAMLVHAESFVQDAESLSKQPNISFGQPA